MRVRSFTARPSASIGLSLVLAAHLWMQFDDHSRSGGPSMENLVVVDGMSAAAVPQAPDGDPMTATMAAMCLVVLTGLAFAFSLVKTRRSWAPWAPAFRTELAHERVPMRHPPWERRSLFAQSVLLQS